MPFTFHKTKLPEVILIEPKVFGDHRGFFMETYKKDYFNEQGIVDDFIQDNHSKSTEGVLRGLHYQLKSPQAKLIRCIRGKIFDVAVDIRKSSPNFGKWVGYELSEDNKKMLYIPRGFAHGFLTIKDAEIVYKADNLYDPESERTILWNDPDINIIWPDTKCITLAAKDRSGKQLQNAEIFN